MMNIIFRQNLNEKIHHSEQKISTERSSSTTEAVLQICIALISALEEEQRMKRSAPYVRRRQQSSTEGDARALRAAALLSCYRSGAGC